MHKVRLPCVQAPHQSRHGPWWWKAFQPIKNVFSSMSFWLFSLGACIWQLTKPKASTGIPLCICLILSSFSPSKVCACLPSLPEQPCICYTLFTLWKKPTLHSHSVGKTQWFLQTGVIVGTSCILVGQHAVPDAEDLCWPHLWIWQQDDRSGFALLSPCFISVDFFSRDRSRDQPLYWAACLVLSSGWLTHDKLGRWWKHLGYPLHSCTDISAGCCRSQSFLQH